MAPSESDKPTILAVDDTSEVLSLLVRILTKEGYLVRSAESGELALAAVTASAPDLILMDVRLQGMDGLEVCRRLKVREETQRIPVILISAFAEAEDRIRGLQLGAADYITKPFHPEELLTRVRTQIALRRATVSLERQAAVLQQTNEQLVVQFRERQGVEDELRHSLEQVERSHRAMLIAMEDQHKAEAVLRESEERFVRIFHSSPYAITITTAEEGRFIDVNAAFTLMSGYTREEAIVSSSVALRLWVDEATRQRVVADMRAGKIITGEESSFRTKTGQVVVGLFSARAIQLSQGLCILASINDISARKLIEAERERLTAAIEQAAEIVLITDARGIILYVNPAFEAASGYAREEVLGKNPRMLKSGQHDAEFYRSLWETITGGRPWHGKLVNKRKDGTLYNEEATISPVRDKAGVITSYVAVKRDITRDLILEEQLLQSQKMEGIGRLAGGVAHDFNNLVSVILSYAGFALERLRDDEPLRADIQEVKKAATRAAALTRQLLAFSRKQVLQPESLDLNQILTEMERMLHRIIGEDVHLVQILASDLGSVKADSSQIEQVIMNLAVNARDAMPDGGKLTIETANVELDTTYVARHTPVVPGPYVMLAVTDSGGGMDQQTLAHIFEPFYTTKPRGKGTGLGLSTVYGIVKQSGGQIFVYSELGAGTTFKVYLPRELSSIATVVPKSTAAPRRSKGNETILVVEDEDALRRVARRALEAAGYAVLTAADGEEALRVSAGHSGDVDLLLTDVVMPRMNGRVLAERMEKARPGIKILYMSGYTDNAIVHHGVLDAGMHFLSKPFVATDLVRKVQLVLDEGLSDEALSNERLKDKALLQAGTHDFDSDPMLAIDGNPRTADEAHDVRPAQTLPLELLNKLRIALTAARHDEILALIETIRDTQPKLAERLARLVNRFDYSEARALLRD